ncbi:MAG: hypothetical protein ACO3EZ_12860 [Prochlorotrichaceae cyanobacterium]
MAQSILAQLEAYSLKCPQEVLLVQVQCQQDFDEIVIFKGFSSSLQRSTPADPDIPLLPDDAQILRIDRLKSPYLPDQPNYIAENLSWSEFLAYLETL